jgi:hypothetical protein
MGRGWVRGLVILVSYLILSNVLTTNTELTINRSVPSFSESFGYNLLVGLNVESKGGWNEEDSKFLYANLDSTGSPIQAQIACRNQAIIRLNSNSKAIFDLFINKYELLWGNDDYGATWNLAFLKEQNNLTMERAGFITSAMETNHIAYMVFTLFSFMTLIYLLQRNASYLYVPILIYLGTVAMHLLVESQNRYHFHVLPVMMIVASVGVGYIFENAKGYVRSSDLLRQEKETLRQEKENVLKQFEEEEHQAIKTRYKSMTNSFDMKAAIDNGNVVVTVSEKYIEPPKTQENQEVIKSQDPIKKDYDQLRKILERKNKIPVNTGKRKAVNRLKSKIKHVEWRKAK